MTVSKRGRPRQYDRVEALQSALRTFHEHGYAGTSLDDLAAAMKMNRPSMYNAFGNKEALYRSSLELFIDAMTSASRITLASSPILAESLVAFYAAALDVYFNEEPARGCFVFCTAPAEAMTHPEIAKDLGEIIVKIDRVLEERFVQGQSDGQLAPTLTPTLAAQVAQAVLHTLALRARAGESRRSLNKFVRSIVAQWCCSPEVI